MSTASDSAASQEPPLLERLPSGRHRLTRAAVVASQRGRILWATAAAVADKGYSPTTVADIVERAGVSRKTFYELFPDKEAAFLAAFDTGVEVLLGRMVEAAEELPADADWRASVRSDLETYLKVLSEEPGFAWALHVEVMGAGPAALVRRAEVLALFTERTRRSHQLARKEDPGLPPLSDELFALHTGGMDELVRDCLRTRGAKALPKLADPAVKATLDLFGDR
jgi:AcrR family transcriptional regulator